MRLNTTPQYRVRVAQSDASCKTAVPAPVRGTQRHSGPDTAVRKEYVTQAILCGEVQYLLPANYAACGSIWLILLELLD